MVGPLKMAVLLLFVHPFPDEHPLRLNSTHRTDLPTYMPQCWLFSSKCCRKEDPFQGPKVGCCLTLRNELSGEMHMLTKQEILLGRGRPGGEQAGKGTQEDCSATWLSVSGFTVL